MSNLNQVFSSLEPYRVLAALAMPISTRDGMGHFTCQDVPYWFDRRKVVALEPSPFTAGDVVDFTTWRLGLREGIAWLVEKFATSLPVHLQVDVGALARQAQRRQQHLAAVLKLAENLTFRPEHYHDASLWLRRHGLDRTALLRVIYAAKGKELNELRTKLQLEPKHLPETKVYIVTPYFADWDQVAALRIEPAVGEAAPSWWKLDEAAHSWMGLHAMPPNADQVVVRTDRDLVLRHIVHSHEEQSAHHQLQVRWTPENFEPARRFDSLLASVPGEDARTIIQIARLAGKLSVLRSDNTPIDWRAQLYQQLQVSLRQHGYGYETKTLVDVLKDDRSICLHIQDKLAVQHPEWVDQFRQQISPMTKVTRGSFVLAETHAGYTLAKSGGSQEQLITNFLLKVDQNIWFDGSDELWHAGRLVIDNQEFPVKFSRRSAGKGDELEGIAASVVQRSGKPMVRTPVLFDTAHKKHLSTLVSHQIANAARVEGVRQLGWNAAGTRFTTTAWRASALGVEPPPGFRHPSNLLLERHFTTGTLVLNNTISLEDPLELLAAVIAMLARSLRGVEVQPQAIHSGPESRLALERLVAAFGQRLAVSPKMNQRSGLRRPFDPDDLNGLPLWIETESEIAARLVCPSFYLSDAGVELTSTPGFTGRVAWVCQQMVQSFLQQPVTHSMPNEASWNRLVFEGRQLLLDRCSGPWDQIELEQLTWRRLLWSTGLDRLGDRFTLDGAWVRLSRQDLSREDQRAIQEELMTLNAGVKIDGLELVLPLGLFNRLVEENLGVRPTVERLKPAVETERLATV